MGASLTPELAESLSPEVREALMAVLDRFFQVADLIGTLAEAVEKLDDLDTRRALEISALRARIEAYAPSSEPIPVTDSRRAETVAYHVNVQTLRAVREADRGERGSVAITTADGYIWTATRIPDGAEDPYPWFGSAFTSGGRCLWSEWRASCADVLERAEAAIRADRGEGEAA